jgi:hypothetical protein
MPMTRGGNEGRGGLEKDVQARKLQGLKPQTRRGQADVGAEAPTPYEAHGSGETG